MEMYNMDARENLKGVLKEIIDERDNKELDAVKAKADKLAEDTAKLFEENKELKAKYDALQNKEITLKQNTGTHTFLFKGMDPNMAKNFKSNLAPDVTEQIAKGYLSMLKGQTWDKTFDGSNAIPVQYSNVLMGLAELQSVALSYANVMQINSPVSYFPVKGTRDRVDAQTPGTANTTGTTTIGRITFTIDKNVGSYTDVLVNDIADANFDIINQLIIPMQAEAVGQNADDEMFNGTEFTSSVSDATASVTASGTVAIAAAITFANLNTMYNSLSWNRGIANPRWFGSQLAYKAIMGLVGSTNDHPIFVNVPVINAPSKSLFGSEYVVTPVIANAPAATKIRLAFGDPKHYTIVVRGSVYESMVNPYILMKEDKVQFICKTRMDGNITDHATPASTGAWTTMQRVDA